MEIFCSSMAITSKCFINLYCHVNALAMKFGMECVCVMKVEWKHTASLLVHDKQRSSHM